MNKQMIYFSLERGPSKVCPGGLQKFKFQGWFFSAECRSIPPFPITIHQQNAKSTSPVSYQKPVSSAGLEVALQQTTIFIGAAPVMSAPIPLPLHYSHFEEIFAILIKQKTGPKGSVWKRKAIFTRRVSEEVFAVIPTHFLIAGLGQVVVTWQKKYRVQLN